MTLKKLLIATVSVIVFLIAGFNAFLYFYDLNKFKPAMAQAIKDATGRELTIGGDIRVRPGLLPTFVFKNIGFQNAPWGSRPHLATVKRLEVKISPFPMIWGDLKFLHLALVEPDVILEFNPSGTSNFDFETSSHETSNEDAQTTLPILIFDDVRIEKGLFTCNDEESDETFKIVFDYCEGEIPGLEKSFSVDFEGAYEEIPLALKGTIGSIMTWVDLGHPLPVDLSGKTSGVSFRVKGEPRKLTNLKDQSFTIEAEGPSTLRFTKLAGLTHVPEFGAFKLKTKVLDSNGKLALEQLNLHAGENLTELSIRGAVKDLRLFLTQYGKKGFSKGHPEKPGKTTKVFSSDPWSLDVLKQADTEIKIRNKEYRLSTLAFSDVLLDIRIENGNLMAKQVKFIMDGGSVDGRFHLSLQGETPKVVTEMRVNQLDLGSMLDQLGTSQALDGKLDAEISLEGYGNSMADVMAGLNGEVFIWMGEGKIKLNYLQRLQKYLGSNVSQLLNPFEKKSDDMTVNCLINKMKIKDGIMEYKLLLDTEQTSLLVSGDVNLKTEQLDLGIQPKPKKGYGYSGLGTISFSLKRLSRPFKLGGSLAKPSLEMDLTRTAIIFGQFAGAFALGPAGFAALLTDVSLGKKDLCTETIKALKATDVSMGQGMEDKIMERDIRKK